MTTDSNVCHEGLIGQRHRVLLPTDVEVTETSHLVMCFTGVWSGIDAKSTLVTDLWLGNADLTRQSGGFLDNGGPTHHFGTMMWTFRNVPAGSYTAEVAARVSPRRWACDDAELRANGVRDASGVSTTDAWASALSEPAAGCP